MLQIIVGAGPSSNVLGSRIQGNVASRQQNVVGDHSMPIMNFGEGNVTINTSAAALENRDGGHQQNESYQSFLERNWGRTSLEILRSYVRDGEFDITNIENFATSDQVRQLKTFNNNRTLDPVEIFERVLRGWYDETLFEMTPEQAKNKLRRALKDSRCKKKIEVGTTKVLPK